MTTPPNITPQQQPVPKRRGCFFYGCITSLVLCVVLALGVLLGVRFLLNKANAVIAEYTDTQPMAMPKEDMPAAELEALKKRYTDFQAALQGHSNTPPLVLTGRELNNLLQNVILPQAARSNNTQNASADVNKLYREHFHVTLDGDKLKGQVSLPLGEWVRVPGVDTKGRYLNGAGVFSVALANDRLSVYIDSLEVKGKPLPEQFMTQLHSQNVAQDASRDPTNAAAISRFESIEVKDSKLIITPKKPEAP